MQFLIRRIRKEASRESPERPSLHPSRPSRRERGDARRSPKDGQCSPLLRFRPVALEGSRPGLVDRQRSIRAQTAGDVLSRLRGWVAVSILHKRSAIKRNGKEERNHPDVGQQWNRKHPVHVLAATQERACPCRSHGYRRAVPTPPCGAWRRANTGQMIC